MVDSPTTRSRLRKQTLDSNVNTHGDPNLNEVLDAIDQMVDGVESLALTGDKTLTTTNYTTADESLNRVLKFTGSLSSAVTVTIPSVEHWYLVVNGAGAQVSIGPSGGTLVAVPNGKTVLLYTDGTDAFNGSPDIIAGALTVAGKISGVTAGTDGTDAVNKTQMETAIAAGAIPGATGTVKVDSAATSDYLINVLTVSGDITLTDNGDSIDLNAVAPTSGYTDGGIQTTSFTAVAGYRYRVLKTSDITVTAPSSPSDGAKVLLECIGTGGTLTWARNGQNVKGAASNNTIPSSFFGDKAMTFTTQASYGWY